MTISLVQTVTPFLRTLPRGCCALGIRFIVVVKCFGYGWIDLIVFFSYVFFFLNRQSLTFPCILVWHGDLFFRCFNHVRNSFQKLTSQRRITSKLNVRFTKRFTGYEVPRTYIFWNCIFVFDSSESHRNLHTLQLNTVNSWPMEIDEKIEMEAMRDREETKAVANVNVSKSTKF